MPYVKRFSVIFRPLRSFYRSLYWCRTPDWTVGPFLSVSECRQYVCEI